MFNFGFIFLFLIEVCWLLYCAVYSQCKITQLEKEDMQPKMYFCDGRNFRAKFRPSHFKCVATVTCLIMAAPRWCFCGVQSLFIYVIYIKCLGFWLERTDNWKKKFRPSQWWPLLDLDFMIMMISYRPANMEWNISMDFRNGNTMNGPLAYTRYITISQRLFEYVCKHLWL